MGRKPLPLYAGRPPKRSQHEDEDGEYIALWKLWVVLWLIIDGLMCLYAFGEIVRLK